MDNCLLYIGTKNGLLVFEYSGDPSLKPVGQGLADNAIRGIAIHPQKPQTAYIGCALPGWGLYRTEDAGQSFAPVGFMDKWVWDVSFHPGNSGVFYVGTEPPMLYMSSDEGARFHDFASLAEVPSRSRWRFFCEPFYAGHVHGVGIHPERPEYIFAGVEHGALIYSHDGGRTWRDALVGYDVHRLIVDPADPDRVFAAAGEGLFVSQDAGRNWTAVPGLNGKYATLLIFDPQAPERAYVNVARGETAIYKTEDGGQSWRPIGHELPMVQSVSRAAYGISLHPRHPEVLFYGSDVGPGRSRLFVSLDAGAHWQPLAAELPKLWLLAAG